MGSPHFTSKSSNLHIITINKTTDIINPTRRPAVLIQNLDMYTNISATEIGEDVMQVALLLQGMQNEELRKVAMAQVKLFAGVK